MQKKKKIENNDTKVILDAMHQYSLDVDKKFEGIDKKFEGIDKRFDGVDKRFEGIEKRLDKIESTMVTKDYLDDKLADLRGDLVVLIRKEDTKLTALLNLLKNKNIINEKEAGKISAMEPFSKIV